MEQVKGIRVSDFGMIRNKTAVCSAKCKITNRDSKSKAMVNDLNEVLTHTHLWYLAGNVPVYITIWMSEEK